MVGPGAVVRASRLTKRSACVALFFLFWTIPEGVHAQRGRGQAAANVPAKASAPIDLTGYWVSLVTEDWRWRMVTPAKGDYPSIPLNEAGKRVANEWDTTPATSFANLDAFTSPGRTTTRFAWILTRERKRDSFTSETGAPRVVLQTCKAIPLPSGNLQAAADGHRPIKPAAVV